MRVRPRRRDSPRETTPTQNPCAIATEHRSGNRDRTLLWSVLRSIIISMCCVQRRDGEGQCHPSTATDLCNMALVRSVDDLNQLQFCKPITPRRAVTRTIYSTDTLSVCESQNLPLHHLLAQPPLLHANHLSTRGAPLTPFNLRA